MKELLKSKKFIVTLMFVSILIMFAIVILLARVEAEKFGFVKVNVSNPVEQNIEGDEYNLNIDYDSAKQLFESYGCRYIEQHNTEYYVEFAKDLFNDDGSSNIKYFENLIHAAGKELYERQFTIEDQKKSILIAVRYNVSSDTFSYTINGIESYFSKVDNKVIKSIEEIKEVKVQKMQAKDKLLKDLIQNNMRVITTLGNANSLGKEGNYSIFLDHTVKTRNYNGKTRNIIFYNRYPEELFEGIKVGTPINVIMEKYPDYAFKGEDYVGYRTKDFYVFCYQDEISIYAYSYTDNSKLQDIIEEYIKTKDLKKFANDAKLNYKNYDYYEFDEEAQNLTLHYPANGIMIDIKNNDPKGIVVYNNFYINEQLKKQVSEGKIRIELFKNSIEVEEKARINN